MQCFDDLSHAQSNTAVALGFFDGLHSGHRSVISRAVRERENGLMPVCLTFSKSPKSVITGQSLPTVMTREDKVKTLEGLGVEQTYFIDFSAVKNLSAEDFFEEILIQKLGAKKLFCGFNYRFGKNAVGDTELLKRLCEKSGVRLGVLPPKMIDGQVVSSTLIKKLIAEGDIAEANKMLLSDFGFSARIKHGKKLGRELGTPTINQPLLKELVVPKFGVYASSVTLENGGVYCGVTNVGTKPTVGGTVPLCETWMPGYSGGEIYGQTADIRLIGFIRAERKFENLNLLKKEILANAEEAKEIFRQHLCKS